LRFTSVLVAVKSARFYTKVVNMTFINDESDRSAACDGATAGISVINILTLSIVDGMSPSEQAH
jgi:hypothetical protein